MSDCVLKVHLQAGYAKQHLLNKVSFELRAGDRLGFVGTSGAGKSTLSLAILGLLPWKRGWVTGEVLLHGKNLLTMPEREARKLRGKAIALVPQSPLMALNGAISLKRHFEEAWRAHEEPSRERLKARVEELMRKVHLPDEQQFLSRKPGEISVGQAQRVAIALALLHRPSVLIADEPTSALDPATQCEVIDLLREINEAEGTALLYISHDLLSVLQLCNRLALLHHGSIIECLTTESIEQHAQHPEMLSLLRTLPVPPAVLRSHAAWQSSLEAR